MCQMLPYMSLWYLQYSMFYLLSLLTKTTGGHQTPTVLIINHIFCCYRYMTTETSWCEDITTYSREIRKKSEKAIAPHSSILAWKIPWMEEPGGLQSMGSLRVRYDWATLLSLFTFMHWRRKWQPTPVFLPGESQGRGSLVGCRPWGRTELDTTEVT